MNEELFQHPYRLPQAEKQQLLSDSLRHLNQYHADHCEPYGNILRHVDFGGSESADPSQLPYLSVQLFKLLELRSVPVDNVLKTLTSSGTTSANVSRIYVDRETSMLQTKALVSIVSSYIGKKRLPMMIVDTRNVIHDRKAFSARGAGLIGFSNFGRDHFYLLDEQMNVDWDGLEQFMDKHRGESMLLFGFTFVIWKYFLQVFKKAGRRLDLSGSVLIHGGGWKKLQEEAVSNEAFKQTVREQFGVQAVHNYYGMVEQVGSIYMECECGYLHAPDFADIRIRDPITLDVLGRGETGIIQTISILPKSYPGHNLLTEDLGTLVGEDDCRCGRKGKYFTVEGRLPKAELRGCSDAIAYGTGAAT